MRARSGYIALVSASCAVLVAAGIGPARAQVATPGTGTPTGAAQPPQATGGGNTNAPEPVGTRQQPEFQPPGLQVGSFHVLPSGTLTTNFDSNIFAQSGQGSSDIVIHTRPQISLDNGPGLFSTRINLYLDDVHYGRHDTTLGHDDFGGTVDILGDLSADLQVSSRTVVTYQHQDPASFATNVPNGAIDHLPISTVLSQDFTGTHAIGRLGLQLTGGVQREDYQNFTLSGALVDQEILDATVFRAGPKFSYEVGPTTHVFLQGQYARRNYDSQIFNSNNYQASVGSDFEFRRLFTGNVFFGWSDRVFDNSSLGSDTGPTYGINVTWFPTELLTVTATGQQAFSDTTIVVGTARSTLNADTLNLKADYEILRQLVLSATTGYEIDTFSNTTPGRTDDIFSAGATLKYLLNRNFTLQAQTQYSTRHSTAVGFTYDREVIGLGLTAAF